MHKHINTDNRSVIASMLRAGYKQTDIANTLNFTKGAISQKIRRNYEQRWKSIKHIVQD